MTQPLRTAPSTARSPAPPSADDAERRVLAAMLSDAVACDRALELLTGSDFYRTGHARLFRTFGDLVHAHAVVDPITVCDALEARGELEAVGGVAMLGALLDEHSMGTDVAYWAGVVRAAAQRRRVIAAANTIIQDAYDGSQSADDLLELAESRMHDVQRTGDDGSFVRLKSILWSTMEAIDRRRMATGGVTGVPTGFTGIDELLLGLQPGDLVVLAARPSMGKTALAINMAVHAAAFRQVPTAIFSLEMSADQLLLRALASEGQVDSQALRAGRLTDDDAARLARAATRLGTAPLWIDDRADLGVHALRRHARHLKSVHGLGLLVIDYLQLLAGAPDAENRQTEVAGISRALKALAKELEIPILVLSQLSRSVEQRTDKRPLLSDLRESGAIEQDADVVCFLYRPEYYEPGGPTTADGSPKMLVGSTTPLEGFAEFIVAKQRNGPVGTVPLHFEKVHTRFADPDARGEGGGSHLRLVSGASRGR
ncbi:MAG: replicative DNA helicase [Gemmatimonadaceae bacterium]|nr:replicative DNA helicase [Gemmatimonadaceae bacterium]